MFGESPVAMEEERHPTSDRVRDVEVSEPPRNFLERLVNSALPFEVQASLSEAFSQAFTESLFVSLHAVVLVI
jgi:hypothetical protein